MAALRITDRTTQFSCSRNGGESVEEKEEEANLDLYFYLSEKQESVTDEGESSNNLQSAVEELKCGEPTRQLPALRQLRKIYNFKQVHINAELVALLVDCLTGNDSTELQYEAARMLRYLARDETAVLIENGAVPYLSDLLNSPSEDVQEQAVRAMVVVAEQALLSFDCRAITDDIILNLLPFFHRPKSPFNLFWFALKALVYIMRAMPSEDTVIALPTLKELLEPGEDTQVQRLACEALSSFSEGFEGVEFIIENGICPCLVELLFHDSPRILLSVMETMANIAEYGNYKEVINDKALSRIVAIVSSGDKRESDIVRKLHKEFCRLVAYITNLTQDDIEVLIKAGVIDALVRLLAEAGDGFKEDAALAIVNGIIYGSDEQVVYFVDLDCINLLSKLITPSNGSLAHTCLDGVERMLMVTKMAALTITDRTKQFSCSRNGGESVEEKEEAANLDLFFYLSEKQESVTEVGESSNNVQSAVEELKCGELTRQLPALRQLRKIYSFKKDNINAELVPLLVDCLTGNDSTELQYEAARMLRYLARYKTAVLIENGAVPYLSDLLNSPSEDVQEQAVRAMVVVAEQALLSFDCRAITDDIILNLLPFFHRPKSPFNLFWFALKALVYIIRAIPIEDTVIALPTLKELLEPGEDTQVQRLACEALSSFSEACEGVEFIIENGICPYLVELLFHDSPRILLSVMETMANIAEYGNYKEVINDKALSRIVAIVSSGDKRESDIVRKLHKEFCRLVAHITNLTQDDIEVLIKAGVIDALVRLLAEAGDSFKEDAALAIVNGIIHGSDEQVVYFVDLDCINLLSNLITPSNRSLAQTCLDGVERMLKVTKVENKHPHLFRNTKVADFVKTQVQSIPTSCLLLPPAKKPFNGLSSIPENEV